jgi:multidrug resistance efflux pump
MRRKLPYLRLLLTLCAALLFTSLGLLWLVQIDRIVVARGRLAGGSVSVRAPFDGRIAAVLVAPGAEVDEGTALVRLETLSLDSQTKASRARIDGLLERQHALERERENLVGQVHPAELDEAARTIRRARLELDRAQKREQILHQLEGDGLSTRLEVEEAVIARELAVVGLESAERALPSLQVRQSTSLEQLAADRDGVVSKLAEERAAEEDLLARAAQATVAAPQRGIVVGDALLELQGQAVAKGQEMMRLAVGAAERFEGVLGDQARPMIRSGLGAKIRLEGYPWLLHGSLLGRVALVSDRRDQGGGFPVEVSLGETSRMGRLYEGMQGEARIVVEEQVSLARLLIERIAGTR